MKVEQCFGLTLWRWHWRVELWSCFSGVPAHAHPGQHVEIIPLFGWAEFVRVNEKNVPQSVQITGRSWLRAFSIPAGWKHWFTLRRKPLIFLSVTQGRSAAQNFVPA